MKELKIGAREELVYIVQDDDLASALSTDTEDAFPSVFATSRMVALMELTAARLMKPILANEELSVGVNVNINHVAATPSETNVRVVAIYRGREGQLHTFDVEAYDTGGKIGSGTHTRAIVDTKKLVNGAMSRTSH